MSARRAAQPFALALLVALTSPGALVAETLQDAWQLAVARDKALAAATLDVEGAQAEERAVRGARWPSLEAGAGYTFLNESPRFDISTSTGTFRSGPIFEDDQFLAATVQVKLPLYTGGQIRARINAAQQAALGASENEQATAMALRLDVAEAYVSVLRARRALRAAESSVESLTAHVGDVQQMVERDLVPTSDLLAARVALANAEQRRVRVANSVEIAQATYNRRLGEPLARSPELDETLPVDASLPDTPIEELIGRAVESRSELKVLQAQADALASRSRAEKGRLLPQLALTGGYAHLDNEILDRQDVSMIGVGFAWNVFDGGQARNHAAALDSASRATRSRLEDLHSMIELEVRQDWLGVQEARARVKASREAVAQAQENLRISRELYGGGLGTNTQVLDAVTLEVEAINNQNNANLDESLATLRLARAVGAL